MAKKIAVYPFQMVSESATRLAEALDVWKVYPDRNFKPTKDHVIINWGNSHIPNWDRHDIVFLNRPEFVETSIDKLRSFTAFRAAGVSCVPWTTYGQTAATWAAAGDWICCRTRVKGMDGSGLVLAKTPSQLVNAKLYTKFIPNTEEYRVYVWMGKVIDILKKKPTSKTKDLDIRTDGNFWIYARPQAAPGGIGEVCISATKAIGLDFAGVDVLWDGKKAYVLETNTAPDIEYITLEIFTKEIKKWLQTL